MKLNKMKKSFEKFLIVFSLIVVTCFMTGCGSDEPEEELGIVEEGGTVLEDASENSIEQFDDGKSIPNQNANSTEQN